MKKTDLAQPSNEALQPIQQLLTPSEIALSREMELTAVNGKTVLTDVLANELFRLYSSNLPGAIEWVFRTHRDASDFWPSIRQLNALFEEFENRQRKEEKAALEAQWTPEGLAQWREILKQFAAICRTTPRKKVEDRKHTREQLKAQAASIQARKGL